MLRLLYRLIVQRVKEYQLKKSSLRQNSSSTKQFVTKSVKLRWIFASGIVLVALASLVFYRFQFGLPLLSPNPNQAQLEIRVDSVANAPTVVFLERTPPPLTPVPENSNVSQITIQNSQFTPAFQLITAGSTIEILNNDPILHNTHIIDGDDTVFNVATPLKSITVRKTMTATGMLFVRCDLHPFMHSWIFVPPNPYYVVVNNSGTVVWADISPGTYLLQKWEAGKITRSLQIHLSPGEEKVINQL